ncbi:phospholipase [Moumouvirus australiensis]|uniref:Phospholipase n=1 Tax=Moumouvirus australiensis TaxID=2109587 RepID=A0A2P1ELI0_9VIRU|nr:phospholipase [Moumouvirus australiensis]AVL94756.1 phospholipase [Moumouvirus australiensis]
MTVKNFIYDNLKNDDYNSKINNLICDTKIIIQDLKRKYNIISEPKYKNLVLSGGSVRGISHIGAIKVLIDKKLLDLKKLEAVAGTSAGSIIGLLIVLGFDIDEIWEFVLELDMKKVVNPDIFLVLSKCGVETGRILYNLFEEILYTKTNHKHINFKQLYDLTKIKFIVVGSCLTTKKPIYYDYVNTPNFKVSMAIRISIGMPGFFAPVDIDGNKYIDGAILDNYPISLFNDQLDQTIGILICNEYNTNYKHLEQYFFAVINLFMYQYYLRTSGQYIENTICVTKSPENVFVFNFDLDNDTKIKIFNCGMEAAQEFIEKYIINQ